MSRKKPDNRRKGNTGEDEIEEIKEILEEERDEPREVPGKKAKRKGQKRKKPIETMEKRIIRMVAVFSGVLWICVIGGMLLFRAKSTMLMCVESAGTSARMTARLVDQEQAFRLAADTLEVLDRYGRVTTDSYSSDEQIVIKNNYRHVAASENTKDFEKLLEEQEELFPYTDDLSLVLRLPEEGLVMTLAGGEGTGYVTRDKDWMEYDPANVGESGSLFFKNPVSAHVEVPVKDNLYIRAHYHFGERIRSTLMTTVWFGALATIVILGCMLRIHLEYLHEARNAYQAAAENSGPSEADATDSETSAAEASDAEEE